MLYTTFTFLVSLFRSANKIYEDDAVVHLLLLHHPSHVSARIFCSLRYPACTDLPVLPPPSGPSRGRGRWAHHVVTFLAGAGRGGDWWNTTTCGMAKDTKDPCICHVDTSHAERPRTESSLLFCNFFYIVQSSRKAYFMSHKLGSLTR